MNAVHRNNIVSLYPEFRTHRQNVLSQTVIIGLKPYTQLPCKLRIWTIQWLGSSECLWCRQELQLEVTALKELRGITVDFLIMHSLGTVPQAMQ